MSQPAMSHALRRLRILLADELLVRASEGRTPYRLTPRATALVDPLDRILAVATTEVFGAEAFDPSTSTRDLTIAASSSTALVAVQPLLARLTRAAPGLSVRLVRPTADIDAVFERSAVDLALLPDVLPTTQLRERLYDEDWVFVAAADNPDVGESLTLEQIARLPHAVFEEQGLRTHAELLLESLGALHRAVVCDDFLLLLHLVAGTPTIALVQARMAAAVAARAGVRIVASPVPMPAFAIDMVWSRRAGGDDAVTWLRGQLAAVMASSGSGTSPAPGR